MVPRTEVEPDGARAAEGRGTPGRVGVSDLVGDLIEDAQQLVRGEVALAKQELREEAQGLARGAAVLAAGGALVATAGVLGAIALAQALTVFLGLALWASYLVVGAALGALGGVLVARGRQDLRGFDPVPREAIDSVRKDVAWLRSQTP